MGRPTGAGLGDQRRRVHRGEGRTAAAGLVTVQSGGMLASTVVCVVPGPTAARRAGTGPAARFSPGSKQQFAVRAYDDQDRPLQLPAEPHHVVVRTGLREHRRAPACCGCRKRDGPLPGDRLGGGDGGGGGAGGRGDGGAGGLREGRDGELHQYADGHGRQRRGRGGPYRQGEPLREAEL